jgi:hypothetical protein
MLAVSDDRGRILRAAARAIATGHNGLQVERDIIKEELLLYARDMDEAELEDVFIIAEMLSGKNILSRCEIVCDLVLPLVESNSVLACEAVDFVGRLLNAEIVSSGSKSDEASAILKVLEKLCKKIEPNPRIMEIEIGPLILPITHYRL